MQLDSFASPATVLEPVSTDTYPDLVPLVVDLDGTLTPTDTLVESIVLLLKQRPQDLLRLPGWLLNGRAQLKDL